MLPRDFAEKYGIKPEILHKLLDVSISSINKWLAPGCDRDVPAYIRAALRLQDQRFELWYALERKIREDQSEDPMAYVIYEQWRENLENKKISEAIAHEHH